jgi:hypothetical protein
MVFSKVTMDWSPKHQAWYSSDKIGLSNILNYDINASDRWLHRNKKKC